MTLYEAVVYVALVTFMVISVTTALIQITHAYRVNRNHKFIDNATDNILGRFVHEVRLAKDIIQICQLPTPDCIELNTYVDDTLTQSVTKKIYYDSASKAIFLDPNTAVPNDEKRLTPTEVSISDVVFSQYQGSGKTKAFRMQMKVSAGGVNELVTRDYFTSAVMRGSY